MSVSPKWVIRERINAATPESPIAIFREEINGRIFFDAIFADTINARQRIWRRHMDLVGIFHKYSDHNDIERALSDKLRLDS